MRWLDPIIRQAAIRIAGRVAFSDDTISTLRKGISDAIHEVRDETLRAMDAQGEPDLAPVLWSWFEDEGFRDSDEVTRHRCATLLAELDPEFATKVLSPKLETGIGSRLGGLVRGGLSDWNKIAVEGLAMAATPAAVEKLRSVRTQGSPEFRELVNQRLVDARKKMNP